MRNPITTPPRPRPGIARQEGKKKRKTVLHPSPTAAASAEESTASAPYGPSIDLSKHKYGDKIPLNAASISSIVRTRGGKATRPEDKYQLSIIEDCVAIMEGARRLSWYVDLHMEEASHVLSRLYQRECVLG